MAFSGLTELAESMAAAYLVIMLFSAGLPVESITLLFSLQFAVVFVADYPTGAVADVFGRRTTYAAGMIVQGSALVLLSRVRAPVLMAICFALMGMGMALMSGSLSAWFVDEARKRFSEQVSQGYINKYFSAASGTATLMGAVGGVVAAAVAIFNLSAPVLGAGFALIACGFMFSRLVGENYGRKEGVCWEVLFEGLRFTRARRGFLGYLLGISLVSSVFIIFGLTWQTMLGARYRLADEAYGLLFTGLLLTMSGGSYSAGLLARRTPPGMLLVGGIAMLAFSLLLLGVAVDLVVVLIAFLLIEFSVGLIGAASNMTSNLLVPSDIRATMLSLISSIGSIAAVGGSMVGGFAIATLGYSSVYALAATVALGSSYLTLRSLWSAGILRAGSASSFMARRGGNAK